MKKLLFLLSFVIFGSYSSNAQTYKDVYSCSELTWYGLDYREAYFIDNEAFPDYRNLQFIIAAWNDLIIYENKKYNLERFFNKNFNYNIEMIKEMNKDIDAKSRITDDDFLASHLSLASIKGMVEDYDTTNDKAGIGLVFIVESYNKPGKEGAYWVTFFDIKSRKVLHTERMFAKPVGGGLRNYWASTYYMVMTDAGKEFGY